MTIRELIEELQWIVEDMEENEDKEIRIAQFQKYGSDFTYEIDSIESDAYELPFYGSDTPCVLLVMGEQNGTPVDAEDYEDE